MIKNLIVDDKEIKYILIKKNNKNTYFRYKDNYLEISMPKKLDEKIITDYLINNFDKFYKKYTTHLKSIPNKFEIILEEKKYKLIIKPGRKFNYKILNDEIISYYKKIDIELIKKKIYKEHLKTMINKINDDINLVLKQNKIKPLPIKISYYKSKFGSYHRNKNEISLNLILAKANINYLYYVIMHEYAHTKEFNHSKKFYKVLEKLMPNYKQYDKTIKDLSIWI